MSATRCCVVLAWVARIGMAASCSALVEQNGMKALGIEQLAMAVLGTAAGSAMQEERGMPAALPTSST